MTDFAIEIQNQVDEIRCKVNNVTTDEDISEIREAINSIDEQITPFEELPKDARYRLFGRVMTTDFLSETREKTNLIRDMYEDTKIFDDEDVREILNALECITAHTESVKELYTKTQRKQLLQWEKSDSKE